LDVEDFSPQRQDRLELAVATLLGRAAGGIALDQKKLGLRGVALLAIRELAGQRGHVERPLAAGEVAGLARRLPRDRRLQYLGDDRLGLGWMLLEPSLERFVDSTLDPRTDLRGHQLVLG